MSLLSRARRLGPKIRRTLIRAGEAVGRPRPIAHFHAMTESTPADWAAITLADHDNTRGLPDRLLTLLRLSAETPSGAAVDRLGHALQAAARAQRDGRNEAYVTCALLHDIGAGLAPAAHAEVAALILAPYVDEADLWMVRHHDVFQGYYFHHHLGHDRHARERYRGHPHFERTATFCHLYDQAAFDSTYPTPPLEAFEPILRRVLARPRR